MKGPKLLNFKIEGPKLQNDTNKGPKLQLRQQETISIYLFVIFRRKYLVVVKIYCNIKISIGIAYLFDVPFRCEQPLIKSTSMVPIIPFHQPKYFPNFHNSRVYPSLHNLTLYISHQIPVFSQ
jgi:hypothetical protein